MIKQSCISIIFIFTATSVYANNALDWQQTKHEVASLTDMHKMFHRSVRIFTQGDGVYSGMDYEYIPGDANTNIDDVGIIHITGNLNSEVTQNDHSELVIGGDVNNDAVITLHGIARVYIGGTLYGTVVSTGSLEIIIKGNHAGTIKTGDPSTNLTVHGDFNGQLSPNGGEGSLVSIQVYGYTSSNTINSIYRNKYTQMNSAFNSSDIKPGIYHPKRPYGSYYVVSNKR